VRRGRRPSVKLDLRRGDLIRLPQNGQEVVPA
jgi:hypothetical protein